ncbi:hypothetical protein ACHAXM_011424 [Skeletonema potamos]
MPPGDQAATTCCLTMLIMQITVRNLIVLS